MSCFRSRFGHSLCLQFEIPRIARGSPRLDKALSVSRIGITTRRIRSYKSYGAVNMRSCQHSFVLGTLYHDYDVNAPGPRQKGAHQGLL